MHPIEDKPPEELPVLSQEELEAIKDPDIITNQIALLEAQCHEMKPNLGAIAEYRRKVKLCYCHVAIEFIALILHCVSAQQYGFVLSKTHLAF